MNLIEKCNRLLLRKSAFYKFSCPLYANYAYLNLQTIPECKIWSNGLYIGEVFFSSPKQKLVGWK